MSYTQLSKKDTEHWFCQAVRREVHPGDSETLSEELIIQPIPPSSGLTGCGIISIDYHVQVISQYNLKVNFLQEAPVYFFSRLSSAPDHSKIPYSLV